jgi:alpha-L-glutamate ligase-like protein
MSGVLGMNRRNAMIARANSRAAIRLVRDKVRTKTALSAHGVPVPPTLGVWRDHDDVARTDWRALGDTFVLKPVAGSMGRGVLVVTGRTSGGGWTSAGGSDRSPADLTRHACEILEGDHTDGKPDAAMAEPLLRSHDDIASMAPVGLPDIRVICHLGRPILAMSRIPTLASGGRGNLHRGGIGAGIDLATGRITRAVIAGRPIERHPDSGVRLLDRRIPHWDVVLDAAARCHAATDLGYLGADVVIDRDLGVVVLEVNGHPGLEIQNVCGVGLGTALSRVDDRAVDVFASAHAA